MLQSLRLVRALILPRLAIGNNVPARNNTNSTASEAESSKKIINSVNDVISRKATGRMFAVVQVCGKQFKVTDNDIIVVEGYWPPTTGDQIRLEKVLLLGSSDFTLVGRPLLPLNQVSVKATVIEKALTHTKVTFTYMKRKQFKNINFLKVPQTHLRINTIELLGKVNELGTPGTGKSKLAQAIATECNMKWVDVSAEAVNRNCCPEYDSVLQCAIMDEDLVVTALEPDMTAGGVILEYHGCDFFPERWIDGVFVVRTDNTILYDRLKARGYADNKIQENISAEIFQTILEEARESYKEEIVFELKSDNDTDFEVNRMRVVEWVNSWKFSKRSRLEESP